jgi:methylglutaconyl-CoA hydratase
MTEPVVERLEGPVLTVAIHRPDVRNAISSDVVAGLERVLQRVERDEGVSVFIWRGSSGWFASGGDLREFGVSSPDEVLATVDRMRRVLERIEALPIPTVAALDGPAVGGGAEAALALDLRIMVSTAYIRFPESHLGITTGWGGARRLRRAVGSSAALEMLLAARKIAASRALERGLVDDVWEPDEFDERLSVLASALAASRDAGRAIKRLLRLPEDQIDAAERAAFEELWRSETRAEAMTRALMRRR